MNKPKWTAGPWDAKPHGLVIGSRTVELVGGTVRAQVAMVTANEIDAAEQQANARLIAESPAMYEHLSSLAHEAQGFLAMADRETHGNTNIAVLRERIRDAFSILAKARGEV